MAIVTFAGDGFSVWVTISELNLRRQCSRMIFFVKFESYLSLPLVLNDLVNAHSVSTFYVFFVKFRFFFFFLNYGRVIARKPHEKCNLHYMCDELDLESTDKIIRTGIN